MLPRKVSFTYAPYRLKFKEPAGTSRGVMMEKPIFLIRITDLENPERKGYGEVPVFPGLSIESMADLEEKLRLLCQATSLEDLPDYSDMSSLIFGMEQAIAQLSRDDGLIFPSFFTSGETSITINGLIWMGDFEKMRERIVQKLNEGFHCIKIKIGAINWDEELRLLGFIREVAGDDITIRVDANGAFSPKDCLRRIEQLADYNIHSIEQPVRQGQLEEMRHICRHSHIPIALDEELIGLPIGPERDILLDYVNPHYLILKPALCYGFSGAADWMERAGQHNTGYWVTSALESSVGLNAIAQFTALKPLEMPQGLGTGNLFTNNFDSPLSLIGEKLEFTGNPDIYNQQLEELNWIGQ